MRPGVLLELGPVWAPIPNNSVANPEHRAWGCWISLVLLELQPWGTDSWQFRGKSREPGFETTDFAGFAGIGAHGRQFCAGLRTRTSDFRGVARITALGINSEQYRSKSSELRPMTLGFRRVSFELQRLGTNSGQFHGKSRELRTGT